MQPPKYIYVRHGLFGPIIKQTNPFFKKINKSN